MNKITGKEPAFPRAGEFVNQPGMTLKQFFIGQSLAGTATSLMPYQDIAQKAILIADTVIEFLNKKQ